MVFNVGSNFFSLDWTNESNHVHNVENQGPLKSLILTFSLVATLVINVDSVQVPLVLYKHLYKFLLVLEVLHLLQSFDDIVRQNYFWFRFNFLIDISSRLQKFFNSG